jgi:hypothetical protein
MKNAPDVCDGTSGEADAAFQGAHPLVNRLNPCLNKQLGAALRKPDKGSVLVQHQPA